MAERAGLTSRKIKATRVSRAPADQQQTEYDSYAALAEPAPHRAGADGQYQPDLRDDQGPGSGANWGNRSPGYRPGGGTVDTNLFPAPPNFQAVPNQFGRQAPPPLYPPSNPLKHHPPPPSGPFNPQPAADGRSIADSLKEFPHAAITTQIAGLAADGFQNNISKKIQDYTTFFNIKYYFEVTTTSVYKKLGILVFPFFRRNWGRVYNKSYSTGQILPLPPSTDPNAPDLYIPVMSIVTYIIMCGIRIKSASGGAEQAQSGSSPIKTEFAPESLIAAGTKILSISIAETLLVKLALYLAATPVEAPWLDAYAICGYKYLGSIITHFTKLLNSSKLLYYSVFGYVELCSVVFTLRTLKMYFVPQAPGFTYDSNYQKNILTLLCIAIVQMATSCWLLLY